VSDTPRVSDHYDAIAAGYGAGYERDRLETLPEYPANYFRLQILANRLADLGARRVYEVGVGEGTPLITLARMGLEVSGCDVSERMVEVAQQNFSAAGLPPDAIRWGDIEDVTTVVDQLGARPYDAVIAAGVLPHVRNDRLFLRNLHAFVDPGGTCFVEFRNKLFSLFTLNRFAKEFFLDDLLSDVDEEIRTAVAAELDERLATELPPVRTEAVDGGPGYDLIPAKFHNPFELLEEFELAGYKDCKIHWYHYHPAPPLLESKLGDLFRREALRMEHHPSNWKGNFLCSAGVVEATKCE